jgi:hypothetical protein
VANCSVFVVVETGDDMVIPGGARARVHLRVPTIEPISSG